MNGTVGVGVGRGGTMVGSADGVPAKSALNSAVRSRASVGTSMTISSSKSKYSTRELPNKSFTDATWRTRSWASRWMVNTLGELNRSMSNPGSMSIS